MARNARKKSLAHTIDSIGWAVFFIWTGTALLAGLTMTWLLIGAAVIILGVQAMLHLKGERVDLFVAAVGLVLLVGAIADGYGSPWYLIPVLLIVIGLAMLVTTMRTEVIEFASDG